MAFITFFDFIGFGSLSILPKAVGMICYETPKLSLSQPHCWTSPPANSFSPQAVHFCLCFAANEE